VKSDNDDIGENDSDDEDDIGAELNLDETTLQRLKQNDPSITFLNVELNCDDNGKCYFNNIDWKKDGDCISNNTQLKTIDISHFGKCLGRPYVQPYILGEEGQNLPTKQQLQDFFSCICQNRSIKELDIHSFDINDEFGWGLVKRGLCGNHHIIRLQIRYSRIGSIGCRSLGEILRNILGAN
jgi:hypothetical protein